MTIINRKKVNKLLNHRRQLMRRAKSEYQEAKNLFEIGSLDFADSLQLANQHYGAAQAITYTLKSMGYDESKRLTAKQKKVIKEWAKQKALAFSIIATSIFSLITGWVIVPFCELLFIGCALLVTKKKWLSYIMAK